MKKVFFTLFVLLIGMGSANAATATMKVTSNKSTVVVGNTITVTINISSSVPMGAWEYYLNYDSSLFTLKSGADNVYVRTTTADENKKSASYTLTFTAKKAGSGVFSLGSNSVLDWDTNSMSVTKTSSTVKIITQEQLEATYSKNNNLASLEVVGNQLDKNFKASETEYNVTTAPLTEKVTIKATREDSKATINGTGEKSLSEGLNVFKVVVTAQNGNEKTYTINITVPEQEPIEITIDGQKYTVIRKKEFLPSVSNYYNESTATINNEEVPAYYNDQTKYTLVGLKDSAGNINLFIYDNDTYKAYNELVFSSVNLYIMDTDLIVEGYEKTQITINGKSVNAYKSIDYEFPLLYGKNIETGEMSFYKYDSKDNTIQRYENIKVDHSKENTYFIVIVVLFSLLFITYLVFIIYLITKNNKKKELLKTKINLKEMN